MEYVDAAKARTRLPELLRRAQQGEEFIIRLLGVPMAQLGPIPSQPPDEAKMPVVSPLKPSGYKGVEQVKAEQKARDELLRKMGK